MVRYEPQFPFVRVKFEKLEPFGAKVKERCREGITPCGTGESAIQPSSLTKKQLLRIDGRTTSAEFEV